MQTGMHSISWLARSDPLGPKVCRKLCQASDQRSVWVRAYEDSNTLLRRDTVSTLRSNELEASLVRATKIYWNWTLPKPMLFSRRQFPRKLPNYDFEANVISGRYLLLAERHGLLWYDLDAEDISNVILSYPCDTVIPSASFLKHQSNANGEGLQSVWVTFTCHSPTRMYVPSVICHSLQLTRFLRRLKCRLEVESGRNTMYGYASRGNSR